MNAITVEQAPLGTWEVIEWEDGHTFNVLDYFDNQPEAERRAAELRNALTSGKDEVTP